ncbi:MAG: multidrug ABC transporter substrate-binding protein [Proteobacteria bacterium]|mgnify:CR=1 FL=1|jgi:putative ABC transport system permease protein|nr:MAG: multidrug ABC transporter substrate-binding protein [Pseudomonadota bacterium]
MILTLAIRNLFHDRIRLIVTLVGILFSIVLVAVQLGLYLGARKMIIDMIENANGEIWITAYGAKSFEEGGILLTPRERHAALATPGVKAAVPLIVSFAEWRKPGGGSTNTVVVGSDAEDNGLRAWNIVEGSQKDIEAPDGVAVDRSYLSDLGITGIGDIAQIERGRVRVRAITEGIRSFTMAPYIFTTLNRARELLGVPGENASYYLVQVEPGTDIERLRQDLASRLPNTEVLTKAEFRDRSLDQWLFSTGAGVALIGGAILGLLVGTVIVAQTLYSSTKDHLNEFATLRALGSSSGYIHKVILAQAGMSAVIGYVLGMAIALTVVVLSTHTALPIIMTPGLAVALFLLTLFMCAVSAISAIMKVTKIDPAMVFSR